MNSPSLSPGRQAYLLAVRRQKRQGGSVRRLPHQQSQPHGRHLRLPLPRR